MVRTKGALGKKPRMTRTEYNKRYYERKKERQEMDEINGAGTIQAMDRLQRAIELFGDEDDIKKKDELQKDIAMAEMEYANRTGDYSGIKGYIFEMYIED